MKQSFATYLHRRHNAIRLTLVMIMAGLMAACSSVRHVPDGKMLLDKVNVTVADDSAHVYTQEELLNFLRQLPNHKMLWSAKLQLGIYNMSGSDTTRWWNRWVRKLGEAPVIYDPALTELSHTQLEKAFVNKGYLHPQVEVDTIARPDKKKMEVRYTVYPGEAHIVDTVIYRFPDDDIRDLVLADSAQAIRAGDPLDRSLLEAEQEMISTRLRNNGYFRFTKDHVRFTADTMPGSRSVELTVSVESPLRPDKKPTFDTSDDIARHLQYIVREIKVITDYNSMTMEDLRNVSAADTVRFKDLEILYGAKPYLRPQVIYDNCFIRSGEFYRQRDVERTYEAFARLNILKFTDIRFLPAEGTPGLLDAYILLTPGRSQAVAFELEGTNSEGDLGVAASVTYTHRNIGKGSETLTAKVRGAYESISGNLDGLIHNRYMEYSVETDLTFPKFKFPLLKETFKRKIKASTQINLSLNYQERPEYTRIVATTGWSYRWTERMGRMRHILTPLDINYVYLPASTKTFLDDIAPDNPLLRYSYENHFIMRLGYSFYWTNKRQQLPWERTVQRDISTVRANIETAGNLLFALSSIFNHRSNFHSDPYKIFGIHYSQYVKAEADYGYLHQFDHRNSLACHVGFGIGIPYGNSMVLPFEKRFYGGGANGVRGWDVRTLGPGSYPGTNSVTDFIHQCGDIRFDMNVEYRAKLFWVFELGLFIDAGNIWTIRDYPSQPGGVFRFNKFYKQIAAAYGAGLRLDFDYFLIRLDLGMKAHNPAMGAEPWPLIHPRWGRDSSFHFSIGYPF